MATVHRTAPTVNTADPAGSVPRPRPRHLSLAECEAWVPKGFERAEEPRPTAYPADATPDRLDALYDAGWNLGYDAEIALPDGSLDASEAAAWVAGYCDGKQARWAEYAGTMARIDAIHDSMRDTYEDEFNERYARGIGSAWGGHDLD